jgi:carbon storage regulator
MLVLTRKVGERIHIGEGIIVTVVRIQNDKVRLGIEAPPDVAIHREEVYRRVHGELGTKPAKSGDSLASEANEGRHRMP